MIYELYYRHEYMMYNRIFIYTHTHYIPTPYLPKNLLNQRFFINYKS